MTRRARKPPKRDASAAKRARALDLVLAGRSSTEAAAELGVDRKTVNRWRSDPEFDEELRARQDEIRSAVHDRLVAGSLAVIEGLQDLACGRDWEPPDDDGERAPKHVPAMARVHAAKAYFELQGRHKNDPVRPPARADDIESEDDLQRVVDALPLEVLEESVARRRPRVRDL